MKITLNGVNIYSSETQDKNEILETIKEALAERKLVLDKVLVNGAELENDLESYLGEHPAQDDEIGIVAVEIVRYLDDQLLTAHDYLERALPAMGELVDQLYRGPNAETWTGLSQLLEGIGWLTQFVEGMGANRAFYPSWHSEIATETAFKEPLENLAEAINNNDPVLIGDIVRYELSGLLEQLSTDIDRTMQGEVSADELH